MWLTIHPLLSFKYIKGRNWIDRENTTQVTTNWGAKVSNCNSFLVGQIASQNNAANSSSTVASRLSTQLEPRRNVRT